MTKLNHAVSHTDRKADTNSLPVRIVVDLEAKYPFSYPLYGKSIRYVAKPVKK